MKKKSMEFILELKGPLATSSTAVDHHLIKTNHI